MTIPHPQPHDIKSAGAILGTRADKTAVCIRMAIRALHGMIEQQDMSPTEAFRAEYELAVEIIDLVGDEIQAARDYRE